MQGALVHTVMASRAGGGGGRSEAGHEAGGTNSKTAWPSGGPLAGSTLLRVTPALTPYSDIVSDISSENT